MTSAPAYWAEPRGVISSSVITAALAHAALEAPRESCGLVRAGCYVPTPNVAADPEERFEIPVAALTEAFAAGDLEAVVHSHPGGPAHPSAADMAGQLETGVPWAIVAPGEPDGSAPGALACAWGDTLPTPPVWSVCGAHVPRAFLHGVADCYELMRDAYAERWRVTLPATPRAWEWWREPQRFGDLYLSGLDAAGFDVVTQDASRVAALARPGDAFLRRVRSATPNHAGLYLGDGLILEHLPNRLSAVRPAAGILDWVTHWLRPRALGGSGAL